ncbi:MAG: glycosyltransferase [Bryobacteraceae bacterium]|nr:glycosyltransferase [Bryobacteraceae bacterium]
MPQRASLRILAISPFLWTMKWGSGVPTLFRTLEGFALRGEVHLVLPGTSKSTFVRDGIKIHVFRLRGWARWLDFGPERSIFSHRLPCGRIGRYLLDKVLWVQFLTQAALCCFALARRLRPDVFYGVTPYGAPVALLLRMAFGGINITRLLGTFLSNATETGRSTADRLRTIAWLLPHSTEALAFRLPSHGLIVTDDGTRGKEVGLLLGRPDVVCWRNGIDLPSDSEVWQKAEHRRELHRTYNIPFTAVVGIYIGQLVRWKRVDRIVSACALLDSSTETVILIVGDGPERHALEVQAHSLGVMKFLRFCGAKSHAELHTVRLGADFFVSAHDLTSACNATFEAMAAALPVVISPFGDTAFMTNGQEGIVLAEATPAALAAAVLRLSGAPSFCKTCGARARQRITADFGSWHERVGREYDLLCTLSLARSGAHESELQ